MGRRKLANYDVNAEYAGGEQYAETTLRNLQQASQPGPGKAWLGNGLPPALPEQASLQARTRHLCSPQAMPVPVTRVPAALPVPVKG
eukprot:jgi/Botrbrau1/5288/Bobra.0391s0009.1